ncbi:LPKTxAVK-anchored surface protein [Streptococcus sp. 10F2]
MKKALFTTLAAVALLAAVSPALANDGFVAGTPEGVAPVAPLVQEEAQEMMNVGEFDPSALDFEDGYLYVEPSETDPNGTPYWVIPRENGYDSIELQYKTVMVDGKEKRELIMPADVVNGPSKKSDEVKEDSKDAKGTEKAVAAAKKEAKAAAKEGQKVLPNTAAVK